MSNPPPRPTLSKVLSASKFIGKKPNFKPNNLIKEKSQPKPLSETEKYDKIFCLLFSLKLLNDDS